MKKIFLVLIVLSLIIAGWIVYMVASRKKVKKVLLVVMIAVLMGMVATGVFLKLRAKKQQPVLLTCSQFGGTICPASLACVSSPVQANDSSSCCPTQCLPVDGKLEVSIDASVKGESINNLFPGGISTMNTDPANYEWQYYKNNVGLKNQLVRLFYNPSFGWPDHVYKDHFEYFDSMMEDIIAHGGTPLISFGGLPDSIEAGKSAYRSKSPGWTGWPYRSTLPPKNYPDWENWVYKAVNHWANVKDYNFYLEIWNEPDVSVFWRGTQAQAFEIYKYGLQGARRANANIKVGGMGFASEWWLEDFLSYSRNNNLELDFLSWHAYSSGPSSKPKEILAKYGFFQTEMINGEWGIDAGQKSAARDNERNPAYLSGRLKNFVDYGLNKQIYFHFEELTSNSADEFHEDFGLFTEHGIIKATFNVFRMYSMISGNSLAIEPENVSVLVTADDNKTFILLWSGETALDVNLKIKNLPLSGEAIKTFYLIDADHSNSFSVKDKILKMDLSKTSNIEVINNWPEVKLYSESSPIQVSDNTYSETLTLKPYSTVLIVLSK